MTAIRWLSGVLMLSALALTAAVVLGDIAHGFAPFSLHARGMAVALILVGAAYALVNAFPPGSLGLRIRAASLGLAFVLWGAEQFMPPGRPTVVADCVLVVIFVVDLSLSILPRLRANPTAE